MLCRSTDSLDFVHWTHASLHRSWNNLTNLTWVLLYDCVILAVLATNNQFIKQVGMQAINQIHMEA